MCEPNASLRGVVRNVNPYQPQPKRDKLSVTAGHMAPREDQLLRHTPLLDDEAGI